MSLGVGRVGAGSYCGESSAAVGRLSQPQCGQSGFVENLWGDGMWASSPCKLSAARRGLGRDEHLQ